jgi:hypothetical protein
LAWPATINVEARVKRVPPVVGAEEHSAALAADALIAWSVGMETGRRRNEFDADDTVSIAVAGRADEFGDCCLSAREPLTDALSLGNVAHCADSAITHNCKLTLPSSIMWGFPPHLCQKLFFSRNLQRSAFFFQAHHEPLIRFSAGSFHAFLEAVQVFGQVHHAGRSD